MDDDPDLCLDELPLDELSRVLDALPTEPLGLHAAHAAIGPATEVFYVPAPAGSLRGRTAFDTFLRAQLRTVRTAYLASAGALRPVAVLATPDTERVYAPVTDESGLEFLDRLRRSAHPVGAGWFFLAHQPDGAHDTVRYFAERREAGEVDTRFGVMRGSGTSHPRDLDDHLVGHLVERLAVPADFTVGRHGLIEDLPAVAAGG